jgi:hypothetical protein
MNHKILVTVRANPHRCQFYTDGESTMTTLEDCPSPVALSYVESVQEMALDRQRLRLALAVTRHEYHDLLAAARAAVAASARGDLNPMFWVTSELSNHGQVPPAGAVPELVAAQTRWAAVGLRENAVPPTAVELIMDSIC